MKICVVAEGCYPMTPGGVTSWLQEYMERMSHNEFVIWAVGANEAQRGKMAVVPPKNVSYIYDVYLDSVMHVTLDRSQHKYKLSKEQWDEMRALLTCQKPNWNVIFDLFACGGLSPVRFLLDKTFLELLREIAENEYPHVGFSDFFWNMRSMFLPLLYLMSQTPPEADLYHSVSAGYAGVLAAVAASRYNKPLVITEHGIYTREREEEILRSDWVQPYFKDLWIAMFYMFTRCAYDRAQRVTCLFRRAADIQQEIGCPAEKNEVVPNGVHAERFEAVPLKQPDGFVDIGAVVRVVPIKDIKTMLYAYSIVYSEMRNVRLHIMGNMAEDEEYAGECLRLAQTLELSQCVFTGRVNVAEYLKKIDFTLLTSISEGQPLAVLEAMAAGRPAVTTDVGCCRELIEGADDEFGPAGIVTPVMHQAALAEAMLYLSRRLDVCRQMGQNGQKRVRALYMHERMITHYKAVYRDAQAAFEAEREGGVSDGGHRV